MHDVSHILNDPIIIHLIRNGTSERASLVMDQYIPHPSQLTWLNMQTMHISDGLPYYDYVISASDDTISGSICDEANPQVVPRSRIPKPRAAKGSEDFTKNNSR